MGMTAGSASVGLDTNLSLGVCDQPFKIQRVARLLKFCKQRRWPDCADAQAGLSFCYPPLLRDYITIMITVIERIRLTVKVFRAFYIHGNVVRPPVSRVCSACEAWSTHRDYNSVGVVRAPHLVSD